MKSLFLLLCCCVYLFSSDSFYYKNGNKIYLTPHKSSLRTLDKNMDFYSSQDGLIVGVNNELIVKIKKEKKDNSRQKLNIEDKIQKKYLVF